MLRLGKYTKLATFKLANKRFDSAMMATWNDPTVAVSFDGDGFAVH